MTLSFTPAEAYLVGIGGKIWDGWNCFNHPYKSKLSMDLHNGYFKAYKNYIIQTTLTSMFVYSFDNEGNLDGIWFADKTNGISSEWEDLMS